ncbi:MAG: hypothetical protein K5986_06050, partial [Clostridium sp.]|nr:hypothetical protein [Clostridium sp.]
MSGEKRKALLSQYAKFIDNNIIEIIIVSVFIAYHLMIRINHGDDVTFYESALAKYGMGFGDYRYHTWTSRIIIDYVIAAILHAKLLWRVAEVFFSYQLFKDICAICDIRTKETKLLAGGLLLLFPFFEM